MNIDNFSDMCKRKWNETRDLAVEYAMDYAREQDVPRDALEVEMLASEATGVGCSSVFDCVYLQDAVAYIVESGLVFDALRGELDSTNNPISVMEDEVRNAVLAALEERADELDED